MDPSSLARREGELLDEVEECGHAARPRVRAEVDQAELPIEPDVREARGMDRPLLDLLADGPGRDDRHTHPLLHCRLDRLRVAEDHRDLQVLYREMALLQAF